jgi:hypothetical protein
MAELVHERDVPLRGPDGVLYAGIRVRAERQPGGTWRGWIEFLPADGGAPLAGDRETTQSNAAAVAYWAEGLEPVYFEGALDRAYRFSSEPAPPVDDAPADGRVIRVRIESLDPELPLRLMTTRTLAPGYKRRVTSGGMLEYRGEIRAPQAGRPGVYEFAVQFGSEHGAALLANVLWSELSQAAVAIEIEGTRVPMQPGALRDALLGVTV